RRLSFGGHLHELDVGHALAYPGETVDGHVGEDTDASALHDLLATPRSGPMVASDGAERRILADPPHADRASRLGRRRPSARRARPRAPTRPPDAARVHRGDSPLP